MIVGVFKYASAGSTDTIVTTDNTVRVVRDTVYIATQAPEKKSSKPKLLALKKWYNSPYAEEFRHDTILQKITEVEKKWYDNISLRGYVQFRYSKVLEKDSELKCEQCDRNWSNIGGFSIRRMRLVFSGHLGKRVFFYIQPDFASSSSSSSLHFAQLRDAYIDLNVDKNNEFRFRVGQSKVPFGFENMQSSQNRLPLDRNDALNSAVSNERDLGVFFYWASKKKRELFANLVKQGLKGSGDYGVAGVGIYNGQTANRPELNKVPHVVARFSYPFYAKKQILEIGVQGYSGKYTIAKDMVSSGTGATTERDYWDQRVAGTFVLYPQPFGIQAEYNFGRGPEYNPATDSIEVQKLHGGYVLLSYHVDIKKQILQPYFRAQYYDGGKKHELDARSYTVQEYEVGIEYQPIKYLEFVLSYTYSNRRFEDHVLPVNQHKGNSIRMQAQLNF